MNKYTAIILTSRDTNEFDRIYIMYTAEAGLVRAVARGVRKPAARLAGHLEPLTLSEIYIARARGMGQITGALSISDYRYIKKNFETLQKALVTLQFFAKYFREEEKDERIFKLLRGFLEMADNAKLADVVNILTEAFWWKLFYLLGHKPEVIKCSKCQKKLAAGENNYFGVASGGILCKNCKKEKSGTFFVNESQIKLLRLFFANPLRNLAKVKISSSDVQGLERIRVNYQKYYFG